MKCVAIAVIIITVLVVLASAAVEQASTSDDSKNAIVTNYEFIRGPSNDYKFGFDTSDGTSRQEQGTSDSSSALAINGSVSWVAQDGSRYQMYFKADKKGYRPIIKRISGP